MLEKTLDGNITIEKVVEKMCHNPAKLFQIAKRGFIREGYYADLAIVDMNSPWTVAKNNILYKCAWSPFDGTRFRTKVTQTFVNGHLAYNDGEFSNFRNAKRLTFDR